MKLTSQMKIIILLVGFGIFAILMFFFGYGIMAGRTASLADGVAQRRLELDVLQREQKSFEQGKIDLAALDKSSYPPDELFSRDTKLVKEIQQLEAAAQTYVLDMDLRVTGTVKSATKVHGTTAELYSIPYTLNLDGSVDNVLMFVQKMEHLPFITHVKTISIRAVSDDEVKATINPQFFIKK
jgi:hypothetical protein